MSKASLPKAKRAALLGKLRAGHDLESAMLDVGVTRQQIAAGGTALGVEINEAFRTGTARLRGKLMTGALEDGNATVLLRLLEKREEAQAAMSSTSATKIDTITRTIIGPVAAETRGGKGQE